MGYLRKEILTRPGCPLARNIVISNTQETSEEKVGGLSDGGGGRLVIELPDLYGTKVPRPSTRSGQPLKKRHCNERRVWE